MINVTSNVSDWTVSTDRDWLSTSRTGARFEITASANPSTSSRSGTVTVRTPNAGLTRTIRVTQQAGSGTLNMGAGGGAARPEPDPVTLTISPSNDWAPSASENRRPIRVTSNVSNWVVSTDRDWLSTSRTNDGFEITVTANPSTSSRSGTVTVGIPNGPTSTIRVTQARGTLSLSRNLWNIPVNASDIVVNVTSNTTWNVRSNVSWLTVSNITPTNSTGNGSFRINATANTTNSQRRGSIVVSAPGVPTQTIPVTQAVTPILTVDGVTRWNPTAAASNRTINVTSNQSWTVSINSDAKGWLRSDRLLGSNNETFRIDADRNTGVLRRGTITVSTTGVADRVIMVTQAASPESNHGEQVHNTLFQDSMLTYNFVTRASWGASDEERERWDSVDTQHSIVLHHTARTQTPAEIEQIHFSSDFAGIGYHFVIGRDGDLYEGRPLDYVGVHTAGHNTGYIGIALAGDFHPRVVNLWNPQSPTNQQLTTLRELGDLLRGHYNIDMNNIFKHSDLNNTDCPGSNLQSLSELFQ